MRRQLSGRQATRICHAIAKVTEKASPKCLLELILTFDVDDEESRKPFESDLGNEVWFKSFTGCDVDEYFLVNQLYRPGFDVSSNIGDKQIEEVDKENTDEFLEQTIVIYHDCEILSSTLHVCNSRSVKQRDDTRRIIVVRVDSRPLYALVSGIIYL